MFLVGIDVSKDKHDCCILTFDGEILAQPFSFSNSIEGFNLFYDKLFSLISPSESRKIKVGLEATGHYSCNLLGFLLDKGLATFVLNPLHTNLFRKSLSLRKTKTDKIDSKTIAKMLLTDVDLKPYSRTSYHIENLKSLCRYRYSKVQERSKLKVSVARLVHILFPEIEKLVSTIHSTSVYTLLAAYPSAQLVASVRLAKLTNLLSKASRGRYQKDAAIRIKNAATSSVGIHIPAKVLELKHTIANIQIMDSEIGEVEAEIKKIMDELNPACLSIPGLGYNMGAMIVSEIGDFEKFSSPDKVLAYSGMSPTTYQSGKINNCYAHMEKRGSRYLRYALYYAARAVSVHDKVFGAYLAKKKAEGKHYYVAISHVAKKLIRLIFHLEKNNELYIKPV